MYFKMKKLNLYKQLIIYERLKLLYLQTYTRFYF